MYPNPQDVLPLPPRPDVAQYRKRAKELVRACKSGDDAAMTAWAAQWVADLNALAVPQSRRASARDVARHTEQIATFAHARLKPAACALAQAQFVLARAHGFESWPKFTAHLDALAARTSPASVFEHAADAIIAGDLDSLREMLALHPALIRARSTREHGATLLHYVAANGVENYRQVTPANIVEIARFLLDAGAEVDATANIYGGGATTLGLAVTSAHPRLAGVQRPLTDLLLERGARMSARIVRDCLMNGCPEAAAHLADRGADVDFESAAGIGRVDIIARHYEGAAPPLSARESATAMIMASWYDQRDVVVFLLDHGVDVATPAAADGDTPLHIAAYQGHAELVDLLLARGAPVNVRDAKYGTAPIVWALHGWLVEGRGPDARFDGVLRALVDRGADVERAWLEEERIQQSPELVAALSKGIRAT